MKNASASLFLLASLAAVPATATAQTTSTAAQQPTLPALVGAATDSLSRRPLPFATVVLQPASGAALSTVGNEHGAFRFEQVPAGSYQLQVRYLGYRPSAPRAVTLTSGQPVVLGAVVLAPAAGKLQGVTVTATKPFIEQRAGKLVLNVAASPIAAGGNAYDVLGRAPGVLEQGGGFQLRGKMVSVLLDGKPTNMSGAELKMMLEAMPANTLDQVEVIANPSARYDANGAAIINIITAKGRKLGTNGTATAGVGVGRYGRYNAGLGLNHRTARLNVYGSLDRQENQVYSTTNSFRRLGEGLEIREGGQEERHNQNNSAKLGFDYELSKNASAGVLLKGMRNTRERNGQNLAWLTTDVLQSAAQVHTAGSAQFLSPSVNVYYKTRLDTTGRTLSLNADYFGYRKDWHNDYTTRAFDGRMTETGPASLLRDNSPARNSVRSASADYTQPLGKGTLEAGLKTTFTTTDNDIRWEQAPAGQPWAVDLGKTNHFIYRENVNAAYATVNRTVRKVDMQLGLRAEQTNTTGTSLTTGQTTNRHYLNLFPSVSAQYNKSEKVQLGLAYSRKIDRFAFGIVNPFVTYISQYRYAQGNPDIRPSFSHNFELTHSYNNLLSTSISYGHHTQVLVDSYHQVEGTPVVVNSFRNYGSAESISASTTLMKPLLNGKWMTVTTLGLEYARVNSLTTGLGAARPATYVSSNHTLTLPYGFKAEASAMYMSPMTFGGLAFKARFSSSLGVSRSFFKDAAMLTLNVTDVLNTQQNRYDVLANGINSVNRDKAESRFVKLNFSYKFGNQRVKGSQRRNTGIEAEKSRMEN
ncbi:TonB-dependent receptor [Hymenobacter guriensis]|uniref:TonB-dependent receptor n=1 Tax=Hymenobacter guriensis TaxID=2793065 RepID=A0ABS0L2K2_9BACT|nr:TonB-dependent receptor [Hymenobacter guriensis]MBG8554351.1 TonB-dependent receptor [Hymenobacter guriensis]